MTETYETTINGEVWTARVVKAARAVAYMESAGRSWLCRTGQGGMD